MGLLVDLSPCGAVMGFALGCCEVCSRSTYVRHEHTSESLHYILRDLIFDVDHE